MAIVKKVKQRKYNILDIELALINSLYPVRRYLVVPNVYLGLHFNHELDLLIVTKSMYAIEIEIKTSLSDVKNDLKKKHNHKSNKIKYLYFAIPEYGKEWISHIPERAGIILIGAKRNGHLCGYIHRKPEYNKGCRKLTDDEYMKLGLLSTMRYWNMKKKLNKLKKKA